MWEGRVGFFFFLEGTWILLERKCIGLENDPFNLSLEHVYHAHWKNNLGLKK